MVGSRIARRRCAPVRNFTVHDMPQRSPEWYQARLGLLTGSCADAVIAERKRGTGELKARKQLRLRLAAERLTKLSAEDQFVTAAMQRGIDMEPLAFSAYEAMTGLTAHPVGFVTHDLLKAGCSPDGRIGDFEGILELKCPAMTTHVDYLCEGKLPDEYRGQVLHALWLTGARWCDFCSFDDRFDESLELFRVRVERNDFEVAIYGRTAEAFLAEVDELVAKLGRIAA